MTKTTELSLDKLFTPVIPPIADNEETAKRCRVLMRYKYGCGIELAEMPADGVLQYGWIVAMEKL